MTMHNYVLFFEVLAYMMGLATSIYVCHLIFKRLDRQPYWDGGGYAIFVAGFAVFPVLNLIVSTSVWMLNEKELGP